MIFKSITAAVLASSALVQGVAAQYNTAFKNMTAVYWGQNGAAGADPNKQYDLFTTCKDPNVDIVVVGFVTKFKGKFSYPIINLSNQCGGTFPVSATNSTKTDILNCPTIGPMITQCQGLGKKIILSLGGSTYTDPGWKDAASARSSANEVWAMFGPPGNNPFPYRPFGNAVVDGYDLDFEYAANAPNTNTFAAQLKAKFTLDKRRTYLLTAAPQCPMPDSALDNALNTVPFDAIFIQFYNNACGVNTWSKKGTPQTANGGFNMQMWQNWATTKSANRDIKLFLGFIAGDITGAGTTGGVTRSKAQSITAESMTRFPNFGGASFWDSSILNINTPFLPGVRQVLTGQVVIKRDVEDVVLAKRDIRTPVGGAADYAAGDFVEVKAPAESFRSVRRHIHRHRRGSILSN